MYKISIIILSFLLTGCLPAIFTVATSSTMAIAKDRTVRETIDDVTISSKIQTAFIKNNFKEFYTRIKIEVSQGRVLLTGRIKKEEDALQAVKIVWDTKGVLEVINELIVDKKSDKLDLAQYTKDTMITSHIKTRIFIERRIKFVNYTIITLNNIVYIFGIAKSDKELETVSSIASKVNGVEKVICHVKISKPKDGNIEDGIKKEIDANAE